jgi:hypothetical protein
VSFFTLHPYPFSGNKMSNETLQAVRGMNDILPDRAFHRYGENIICNAASASPISTSAMHFVSLDLSTVRI